MRFVQTRSTKGPSFPNEPPKCPKDDKTLQSQPRTCPTDYTPSDLAMIKLDRSAGDWATTASDGDPPPQLSNQVPQESHVLIVIGGFMRIVLAGAPCPPGNAQVATLGPTSFCLVVSFVFEQACVPNFVPRLDVRQAPWDLVPVCSSPVPWCGAHPVSATRTAHQQCSSHALNPIFRQRFVWGCSGADCGLVPSTSSMWTSR